VIKRSGVEIMNDRTKNVSIAKETIEIIKRKSYTSPSGKTIDISDALNLAISNTKYYDKDVEATTCFRIPKSIEIVNETAATVAARWLAIGITNVVALNFASATCPGGGFVGGAIAQEEDLCRASGLYACIKNKPAFYNANILCDNHYYTDGVIYSPNVPFFRNDNKEFLEEPFFLSIITSPAPCVRNMEIVDKDKLASILMYRSLNILKIAKENGHKNIILGAWGAGAFGNDPAQIATIFMDALKDVPVFENVCFAVYDTKPEQPTYATFKEICL